MTTSNAQHIEAHIRYMEMIQRIIARMANNSTSIKRYAIVVTAAAVSFAKFANAPLMLLGVVFTILIFSSLDAHYLRLERCYRTLHDIAREQNKDSIPDFSLDIRDINKSLWCAFASPSVWALYAPLILFTIVAAALTMTGIPNGDPKCPA